MYTQRIIHVPVVGKSADLRAALLERNASGNADAPHALSVHMFAPQPGFVHSIRFENLAAIEAYQGRQLDAAFLAQGRKIDQCLAQERVTVLYEELGGTGATAAPKFLIRNRYCPAPGKGAELRAVLEERVRKGGTPGLAGAGLSRQVASLDGPAFAVTLLFASMADMDLFRSANEKDATFLPYLNKVASLSRAPVQQRMQRILAPFPA
jgi:hypothetical protein